MTVHRQHVGVALNAMIETTIYAKRVGKAATAIRTMASWQLSRIAVVLASCHTVKRYLASYLATQLFSYLVTQLDSYLSTTDVSRSVLSNRKTSNIKRERHIISRANISGGLQGCHLNCTSNRHITQGYGLTTDASLSDSGLSNSGSSFYIKDFLNCQCANVSWYG